MLTPSELILIAVMVGALSLIGTNRLRSDIVALLVLLALGLTGLVTPQEAVSGFSRLAVITIMGLFIISEGLEQTGVIQKVAFRIRQIGGTSELGLVVLFMLTGAGLSLLMNNIAVGAVLLPAAVQVGREANVKASKLLIPLAFGTLVGGMATLFTTANIVLSGVLQENGRPALNFTDFFPTGGVIVLLGLLFMATIGRRLLPNNESLAGSVSPALLSKSLRDTYQLDDRLWEVRVPAGSRLVNTALSHSRIGEELGVTVLAMWRNHQAILAPSPIEVINANDYLLVLGREDRVMMMNEWGAVVGRDHVEAPLRDYSVDLTEVVIPPRSGVIGKTLKDLRFRIRYGLTSVALWREGRSYRTDVGLFPLEVGDALLMVGSARSIKQLAGERDFLVLQSSHAYQPPLPQKGWIAAMITAVVLLLSMLEIVPTGEAMLAGAVAMVLTGCLNMDDAYRAIEWRVVFLIAGMLPLSIAMNTTGLADRIGSALVSLLAPYGALALIAGLFLVAMLLTQVIAGQISALIIGPIAIPAAISVGVNPEAMAVAVAIACSTAFLSPLGHPVNVLMMGPGGYKFSDFLRVGVGMTLLTMVGTLIGMTLFWGIR